MQWLHKLGPESRSLKEINTQFLQMLEDGRHVFDASANALLGGTDPEVIREDLFRTDQRINRTEQAIRREIVIHGSIHGAGTFPALLVLMSLVKDAERIGDYCKNIYHLATVRPYLGDEKELASMVNFKDEISRLIVRAHSIVKSQDEGLAKGLVEDTGRQSQYCDEELEKALREKGQNMAGRVLAYRYFKRVVSHTSNIVSSVIMPLDLLDYFDEPKG
jgi:phosphate transport system protein